MIGLLPFFTVSTMACVFLSHHNEFVHSHLLPTTLYLGVVFAYMVGTIIVAHVSKQKFPYWNMTWIPLILGLADVYITPYFRKFSYPRAIDA